MPNIELFDEYVARILSRLYEAFPMTTGLDVRRLTGHHETDEYGTICAPDGRRSRQAEVAYATIEWLVESGFVQAKDSSPPYGFGRCRLTIKGLEALNAIPESIQTKESLGDKLTRLVKEGSIDLAREVVKMVIASGVR